MKRIQITSLHFISFRSFLIKEIERMNFLTLERIVLTLEKTMKNLIHLEHKNLTQSFYVVNMYFFNDTSLLFLKKHFCKLSMYFIDEEKLMLHWNWYKKFRDLFLTDWLSITKTLSSFQAEKLRWKIFESNRTGVSVTLKFMTVM